MGIFLQGEKPKQAAFKLNSGYFSDSARADGEYFGQKYPFCLPQDCAEENLVPEIRQSVMTFFHNHQIKWRGGWAHRPSAHMCDSQVCCVNFLFPLADKPDVLAEILRPIYPGIREMCRVEEDSYVSFERAKKTGGSAQPHSADQIILREALHTSADAIVAFIRKDGKKQVVLIEWKYAESFPPTKVNAARQSYSDRTAVFQQLYESEDFPLKKELLPSVNLLFNEPFAHWLRLQYMAKEMELAHEEGADLVSVLHVAPAHNREIRRVTSLALKTLGNTPADVWRKLMKEKDRSACINTEELFGNLPVDRFPMISEWLKYIRLRYPWVNS